MARGFKTGGRKPGAVNKVDREFRATVQRLLEDNSANFSVWLEEVAAKDSGKALDLIAKLAEFAAPKLARTIIEGEMNHKVSIVDTLKALRG
jgi:hypothetical protein